MESSKRSLFCVMAKVLEFYTAMFSLFLFGRWLPGPSSLEAGVF